MSSNKNYFSLKRALVKTPIQIENSKLEKLEFENDTLLVDRLVFLLHLHSLSPIGKMNCPQSKLESIRITME